MTALYLLEIAWYLIGYASFIYWVRFDEDVTLFHILFGFVFAFGGPFVWLFGFLIWIYYKLKATVVYRRRAN